MRAVHLGHPWWTAFSCLSERRGDLGLPAFGGTWASDASQ